MSSLSTKYSCVSYCLLWSSPVTLILAIILMSCYYIDAITYLLPYISLELLHFRSLLTCSIQYHSVSRAHMFPP